MNARVWNSIRVKRNDATVYNYIGTERGNQSL